MKCFYDIRVPPIFVTARTSTHVSRLQKHQLRMLRLCEEARCNPNLYNPSIKQYKDSQMCNNSGKLFVHMFVYCSCMEHVRGADHQRMLLVV